MPVTGTPSSGPGNARTNETLVKQIIQVDSSVTDLDPFILAAHNMVEKHCTDIEEAPAKEVETWLAAHFITIRDMRSDTEKVSSVSQKFQFSVDLGLSCSMYGQQAMQVDPTGGLARWNDLILKGKAGLKGKATWLGTPIT